MTGGRSIPLRLEADDGHDVDLYLSKGSPEDLGTDETEYNISRNGSGSYPSVELSDVEPGTEYALLVTHENATETGYGARHYVDCGGDSDGGGGGSTSCHDSPLCSEVR